LIITQTPLRISFFGGGTDYPDYFEKFGEGAVLGTAIDKYIYFLVSKFYGKLFDHSIRISYSQKEFVNTIEEIKHVPFRECLRKFNVAKDIEINCAAEVPAYTGLGSSATFIVGLINSLHAFKGNKIGKLDLVREAIHFERETLKEPVGYQDQVFAAFGGLNLIKFSKNREISVNPIKMSEEKIRQFEDHLMIFFTGIKRKSSEVIHSQLQKIGENEENLKNMRKMVDEGYNILTNSKNLNNFGRLLDKSWNIKKNLDQKITNEKIDKIYEDGLSAGAIGGKLLGAGAGGFILFVVPPERRQSVREKLRHLVEIPIKIESNGSTILKTK